MGIKYELNEIGGRETRRNWRYYFRRETSFISIK